MPYPCVELGLLVRVKWLECDNGVDDQCLAVLHDFVLHDLD